MVRNHRHRISYWCGDSLIHHSARRRKGYTRDFVARHHWRGLSCDRKSRVGMEYFESTNEKLHVAKLKLMRSYFNLYALILVGAALLDFIAAAFLGLWQ